MDRGRTRAEKASPRVRTVPVVLAVVAMAVATALWSTSCGLFDTVRVEKIPVAAMFELIEGLKRLPRARRFLMRQLTSFMVQPVHPVRCYNVAAAARIKQAVRIPVIVVGGLRSLDDLKSILENGQADYVAMSRPLIRNPDLVARMQRGTTTASSCHDCGYCLMGCLEHPLRCYDGRLH